MVEYRIFRVNAAGMIDSGKRVRCADDKAALELARGLDDAGLVEVWSGKRRVGNVPPRRFIAA